MAAFQDRVLKCVDCGGDFEFTAGEQQFYQEKDFKNEPKRCKACKAKRQSGSSGRGGPAGRVETSAVCSQCGKETTVPFKPTQGRPVLCRECFKDRRATGATA
jgi:CxxC-x17-CxxC domain-containing protein